MIWSAWDGQLLPGLGALRQLSPSDASEGELATLTRLTERYRVVYQTLCKPPEIQVSRGQLAGGETGGSQASPRRGDCDRILLSQETFQKVKGTF